MSTSSGSRISGLRQTSMQASTGSRWSCIRPVRQDVLKAIERDLPATTDARRGDVRSVGMLGMFGVGQPGEVHRCVGHSIILEPIGFATAALASGHRVVMMSGAFDAETCLATIARERVTWLTCVPTHLIRILALPQAVKNRYDLSSLKAVLHSAAPCPRDVKRAVMELLPPGTVWEIYGGTEGAMTMISPQEWLSKPGSVGRAFPAGSELKILDTDGNSLPAGMPGLIYARPMMNFRVSRCQGTQRTDMARGALHVRRCRLSRRGWLSLHHRSSQGHDYLWRSEHLSG